MSFNPNDHNRIGSQKEVGQCCNCIYNEHDILKEEYRPHLVCEHPEIMSKNDMKSKLIAMVFNDKDSRDPMLDYSKEYKEQLKGFPSFCPLER